MSDKTKNYDKIDISYFKSIVDQDRASVVICNLSHEIIYMNPAAVQNYSKHGGDKLIGKSLLCCHNPESGEKIQQVIDWLKAIILYILFIMRSRIKMYIWWRLEMKEN